MRAIVAVIIGMSSGMVAAGECLPVPETPDSFDGASLAAGSYSVRIFATEGSKKSASTRVRLELRPTNESDVSTATGEVARDPVFGDSPLYGWILGDLEAVGAVLCPDEIHPEAASRDPVYPGVLVFLVDWFAGYPERTPVLAVGTISNRRDGSNWLDGCGIGLTVRHISDETFAGHWEGWGLMRDGKGYFCASRTSPGE
jgi:hypothetical protein